MKIVIIGAGTSGLAAAALLDNYWGDKVDISLYYDPNNKNIAVGEGTTPQFVSGLCQRLGYQIDDAIRDLDATIKLGVRFKNWIPGKEYFHGFGQLGRDDKYDDNISSIYAILNDCFIGGANHTGPTTTLPNTGFIDYDLAFHIETQTLSDFLFNHLQDSINIIPDVVEEVISDGNNIQAVRCKDSGLVEADFWVDASGFNAILLNKLNPEWVDISDYLPIDRAIPQQVPNNSGEIPSYTLSEATKNGWIWTIPTQNRLGTGYLYSSKFTTDDEAREDYNKWLIDNHGVELQTDRVISYKPGHWKDVWIGNCFAVGLSGGFVEPLESLGHHYLVFMLEMFTSLNSSLKMLDYNRDRVNQVQKQIWEDCINFLGLHYCTNRTDSPFWRYMTDHKTHWVKTVEEKCNKEFLDVFLSDDMLNFWDHDSYTQIMNGLQMFNKQSIRDFVDSRLDSDEIYKDSEQQYNEILAAKQAVDRISHREVLETIKGLSTLPYLT